MTTISFMDFLFPQIAPQNWQNGISIFNSGGIHKFANYGELISAKIKAGIGEEYEVRLKLHAHGKCVQWMECTCQKYRRRNEKCEHIAAFCLYVDQEKSQILSRFGIGSGGSEKFLNGSYASAQQEGDKKNDVFGTMVAEGLTGRAGGQIRTETNFVESLISSRIEDVERLEILEDAGVLSVSLMAPSGKKVVYHLRADDAVRLLADPTAARLLTNKAKSKKRGGQSELLEDDPLEFSVKRVFDIRKNGKFGIKVAKCLVLNRQNSVTHTEEQKIFALADYPESFVGRNALYVKGLGFVRFADQMSYAQIFRWEEYPKIAFLENDTVAQLFQSGFARLRETAEVRLAADLQHMRVSQKLGITELNLVQGSEGYFIVEPKFKDETASEDFGVLKSVALVDSNVVAERKGASKSSSRAQNFLLSLIKARMEGRQYLQTQDGWLQIPENLDWIQSKLTADGKLKLNSIELIKFREQIASDSEISGSGDIVARIRAGLVAQDKLETPSLNHTLLRLRGYQVEGLKWLWWLYSNGLGGLLADEMGLGKTHQAMALMAAISGQKSTTLSLVVCPTSVLDHWLDKLAAFVPSLKTICFHGTHRRPDELKKASGHTVVVTSYGILLREINLLTHLPWSVVLLDEAHLVKNQTTRTYRAACRLRSEMRLCLTGTPLENDLMELKNLFDFIAPNYLGSDAEFKKRYISPNERDPLLELELQRMIHPFKMRRHKKDVLPDLPEKVEDIRHCHLNREQYELYSEALALRGQPLVETLVSDGQPVPYVHVFAVISILKQICDDPGLIDQRYSGVGSGKLELFEEILQEALDAGQKVVVFSQYAKMIERLSTRLTTLGIDHVSLTGSTTNRGKIVKQFQEDPAKKVFLGSLLAGGTGIDLTSASVVIHFDRWWNAAKENQATDRIHRIGQNRNVQVYKLVTKGTLEERIDQIINRKRILFDRFVDQDAELFKHLTRQDLLELLAPPETYRGIDVVEREALQMAETE